VQLIAGASFLLDYMPHIYCDTVINVISYSTRRHVIEPSVAAVRFYRYAVVGFLTSLHVQLLRVKGEALLASSGEKKKRYNGWRKKI